MSSTLPLPPHPSQSCQDGMYRSSLKVSEVKPPPLMMAGVDPEGSPCPGRPPAAPGCRTLRALALCFGLAEVHTWFPSFSSPPVYSANSQMLHTVI